MKVLHLQLKVVPVHVSQLIPSHVIDSQPILSTCTGDEICHPAHNSLIGYYLTVYFITVLFVYLGTYYTLYRFNSDSIQIQFRFSSDSVQIQIRFSSDSIQIQFRFTSDSLQIGIVG
ncbi:hypothetical protein ACN38_g5239 [Penicillium nordicum]|uniref:Transmembrane protein n=1 Tax=Penicillium nordicum TaxID=229535 RepID=A0A0M8P961_9EURO|nr:hypothetical protein ACN38_g5239 [Penicillium nordicum]